jgi:hypothetical protein
MAMPQTIYYSAPEIKVGAASGSAVDLSEFCKSAVVVRQADALESSSMASRDRFYQAGMNTNSVTATFNQTYASALVYATLSGLVGTQCYVEATPVDGTTVSATNPKFTLENCYLESLEVLAANLGELGEVQAVFTGGKFTAVVGP